ncbi:Uncharacterised protein [Chlamydia trachomatis]|nr:Uncharacterised protein [Chlamydia trachomatis]
MSRAIEVIIGKIITARTTLTVAALREGLAAGPAKSGIQPKMCEINFQNGYMDGTSTNPPQRP